MKVELISYTKDAEKIVAAAAKLCYSSASVHEIMEGLDREKTQKFIELLLSMGHESPIEHVSFTFAIEGVSRSLLAQLTRHRIASYSVKSQRYVTEGQFEYVVPPEIAAIDGAKEIYNEAMHKSQEYYNKLLDILQEKHFNTLIAQGKPEKKARTAAEKLAAEDARFVLPNACETQLVTTFNARSLFNFFNHRCCERAQWEIREMANEMLKLVKEKAPVLFKYAGPPCLTGPCPEGVKSCGKQKEKRDLYLKNL